MNYKEKLKEDTEDLAFWSIERREAQSNLARAREMEDMYERILEEVTKKGLQNEN